MITERENRIRNRFFEESGMKAYVGHINGGDTVIWKEEYVKWLENKLGKYDIGVPTPKPPKDRILREDGKGLLPPKGFGPHRK